MNMLIKQYRDFEKEIEDERVVPKREVVDAMFENWQDERNEEKDIVGK